MYRISDITRIIGADRYGMADADINWLLIDSRSLSFPSETLFFAIHTQKNDGHKYIKELYKRGVRNFVVQHLPTDFPDTAPCNFLLVEDSLTALQTLAAHHRQQFDIPVVAITGSNGKTIVKEWLYQLLSPDFNVCRSPRSYNSQYGVPLSLWLMNSHHDIAIIEAGISYPGEMERLEHIIRPDIGVLTNIGAAHQENFLSLDHKRKEKLTLMAHCKDTIIEVSHDNKETCLAICEVLQKYLPTLSMDKIRQRLDILEPVAMRLEVKEGINYCTLINDTYNSDINSLDIALDFMQRRNTASPATLILSDILQSGESPRTLYQRVAEMAQSRGITHLIGVGEQLCQYADYFPMQHHFFPTTDALIHSSLLQTLHNEFVLIKGARDFRFEHLVHLLTQKVHQTILEVNLTALIHNLNYYRNYLQSDTHIVCMVKASAYGTGALEVSKTLQDQGVDYLAVAVADEGLELRQAGITTNIMVMNPEPTSFKILFDYQLQPEIYNFQILDDLIHAAEQEGITNYPVHIKIDTGMHRLGFDPEKDLPTLIQRLIHQSALVPCSVFSHFVGSDSDDFDTFSHHQHTLFLFAADHLQAAYPHKILRHMCNTAGIEHFPRYHHDMVRLGLGLYGINPRDEKHSFSTQLSDNKSLVGSSISSSSLRTVATLKTTILQIRDVPSGDSIGYSRRTILDRDSRVAAIPIGYADGLNRYLGNRNGYALVNGKKAPYLGNICMDVCMIDVTDIDCKEGDTVIIFGEDLPITTLSDTLSTIPYEILTSVSTRVQRIYIQE